MTAKPSGAGSSIHTGGPRGVGEKLSLVVAVQRRIVPTYDFLVQHQRAVGQLLFPVAAIVQPLTKHPEDFAVEARDRSEVPDQRGRSLSGSVRPFGASICSAVGRLQVECLLLPRSRGRAAPRACILPLRQNVSSGIVNAALLNLRLIETTKRLRAGRLVFRTMEVTQFVHEGLGNSSYLVDLGGGEAIVVDPDRTARRYLEAADRKNLKVVGALETHVHADFVTGAIEVATATDATIYNPKDSAATYAHHPVGGGDGMRVGEAEIEIIAAPGHTPEHVAYVVRVPGHEPVLFSGGSMIVGGAARSDLLTPEQTEPLSRAQYRTLREAFRGLPDSTLLYPTHGGGSFCSAGGGDARASTLGEQKVMNPALREMSEDEFVEWFPSTFPSVPNYYWKMRAINQAGPRLRRDIAEPKPLDVHHIEAAGRRGVIVDVRQPEEYLAGHIPGSLANPYRDVFGVWMGWLVELGTPLAFVCDGQPLEQVIDECLLVGHEELAAVLDGGFAAWEKAGLPVASDPFLSPVEARKKIVEGVAILDVREPDEWAQSRIEDAVHIPLGVLEKRVAEVPRDRPVLAYCGAGMRSTSAASILERAGIETVMSIRGGFDAWQSAGEPVVS